MGGWTIEQVQRPTLVIAHNKTLAAQLCNEFREFFPTTRSSTSSPTTTTTSPRPTSRRPTLYIEKDSSINEEIDRLRHSATSRAVRRAAT
jgi:excinuclease ABC subunit B